MFFRMEARLPRFLKNGLAVEAEQLFRTPAGKLEFMRSMDDFQGRLYALLLGRYADQPFCQLLTLKLCNLAVAKFHFLHGHSVLMSAPFQLTVDPSNACQLACPACVHTSNREYSARFDWPRSMLPVEIYGRFLEYAGPFAFCASLYNYGEPLLHKRFPEFVRESKKYLLFTTTSTNLSMPLDDPEGIVRSGLDRMILSIDGTTQEAYARYRRKGEIGLVFENVGKLVAAKKKLASPTPYLVWQFLTFEHNAHQVKDAIALARRFGVNELLVETPFEVAIDDPQIRSVVAPSQGSYRFSPWTGDWCSESRRRSITAIAPQIETLFHRTWEERCLAAPNSAEANQSGPRTCDWLYHNLTIDGAGRIMPCCMAPASHEKHLVFERLTAANDGKVKDLVNSSMARLARLAFAKRSAYERETAGLPEEKRPYCAKCKEKPLPYGLANVAADIRALDAKRAIPRGLQWTLTHWK